MRPNIFLLHSGNETFVRLDREILSGFGDVNEFYARRKFPLDFFRFWNGVGRANIVFCWFASWNSLWVLFFAKILHKPSVLVVGGYDVANLPEANYGSQRGGIEKIVSRLALHLASVLLPFSLYSQKEAHENCGISDSRMRMLYIGVPDPFDRLPDLQKEHIALTVGNLDWANLKRKGLEPFVRSAAQLPDVQFVLVGGWKDNAIDHLRAIASPNVVFTNRVSDEELLEYYRRASVYVQASLHEGFGLSVAESMLGGCVPVVSRLGSLPEVVGECGVYVRSPEPHDVANAIQVALRSPEKLRLQARNRILAEFPLDRRRKALLELVTHLIG